MNMPQESLQMPLESSAAVKRWGRVTVGFSAGKGPFAALIRWITKAEVSHAWISLEVYGKPYIYHASIHGAVLYKRSEFEKHVKIVDEFEVIPDIAKSVQHVLDFGEMEYDFLGLFGFLKVLYWRRWFGKKVKNPWASPKLMVCSELVAHLGDLGELPEYAGLDHESTTPKMLRDRSEGASFKRCLPRS